MLSSTAMTRPQKCKRGLRLPEALCQKSLQKPYDPTAEMQKGIKTLYAYFYIKHFKR